MKKNIFLITTSFLILLAGRNQAEEWCTEDSCANFSLKFFSGANFLQSTTLNHNKSHYHAGYVLSGSLIYELADHLHLEAEYAFRKNTIKQIDFVTQGSSSNGCVQTSSYMASLLYDLPWKWYFKPFIGAGIGYDFHQMHASNSRIVFNQKWHHFAWQAIAGLAYSITCNTEMTLEYKFHQGGSNFYNHAIGLGLSYKFGLK